MIQDELERRVKLRRELFISAILGLWDRGFDTQYIAKTLREDQAGIERALHQGLNQRYMDKRSGEQRGG